ncbi:hypothetical protein UDIV_1670 [Ureaplasma diversum NCTC 246]|uniref:Uncharacterized protein n=1 Tax=Ureaplasma diversum NCTC 246 TaxID=1188241 RepID=A0A084F1C6_9BACT|nr:hypothetical protein UDIV_1670 [Ureaplasma diversum NCTC 246]
MDIIVVGIPIICISNFKLDSTIVEALWILKLNCQPPSRYNSKVFLLPGLYSKLTIRVGSVDIGNSIILFFFCVSACRF